MTQAWVHTSRILIQGIQVVFGRTYLEHIYPDNSESNLLVQPFLFPFYPLKKKTKNKQINKNPASTGICPIQF